MSRNTFIHTRNTWADPLSVAREILTSHPRFRHLSWCDYWHLVLPEADKNGRTSWWPLAGYDLEDAIRLHIHRTRQAWPSDRLVSHVVSALECLCRQRSQREVA